MKEINNKQRWPQFRLVKQIIWQYLDQVQLGKSLPGPWSDLNPWSVMLRPASAAGFGPAHLWHVDRTMKNVSSSSLGSPLS